MTLTGETTQTDSWHETDYERPPEQEIYGRSLSTIYRLGAFMVSKSVSEARRSPEADQARAEFFTSVEEGFGTDMELGGGLEVRDFDTRPVIDGRVTAKDQKTSVSDMTYAGLVCASEKAKTDQHFLPQLIRSQRDHDNALIVDSMASGETSYNTRIVVSPFPEEAAAISGDDYWRGIGYVPHLKRGFVQMYHADGEEVIAGSLSFDGSNKEHLRALFSRYGIEIPESEVTDNWLQYAITDNLSADEAQELALEIANNAGDKKYKKSTNTVDVTQQYGEIMNRVFDESYVHACESLASGRQSQELRKLIFQLSDKARHFNQRYTTALYAMRVDENRFTDDDMVVLHELLVYSTIEMMRAFHLEDTKPINEALADYQSYVNDINHHDVVDPDLFLQALSGFGAQGAINNRVYSACGLSISLGEGNDINNPQTAFGGQGEAWAGGPTHFSRCVNCNEKKLVGVKNWCKQCISGHCGTKK